MKPIQGCVIEVTPKSLVILTEDQNVYYVDFLEHKYLKKSEWESGDCVLVYLDKIKGSSKFTVKSVIPHQELEDV